MAQLGVKCPRGLISWDECLGSCAHDPLRPCDYTADMLWQMRADNNDEPGDGAFSPSRLLGCARQAALIGERDYYVDVQQAYPSTRGNMVHALMEKCAYPGALYAIREHRFHCQIETKYGLAPFSAKPDLIVVKDIEPADSPDCYEKDEDVPVIITVKILDYKSTVNVDNRLSEAKLEHQLQVNMYAWIVTQCLPMALGLDNAQVVVDELEIEYCTMADKRRFTSAGSREVPCRRKVNGKLVDSTLKLEPIKLWDMAKVGRYIQAKITERLDAQNVRLPDILEGEQAWLCRYCPIYDFCHNLGNERREDTDG